MAIYNRLDRLELSVTPSELERLAVALAASLVFHVVAVTGLVHFSPGAGSGLNPGHSERPTLQLRLQSLAAEAATTTPEIPPIVADNTPLASPPTSDVLPDKLPVPAIAPLEGGPRSETGLVSLPQPYYHTARELDRRAVPKTKIKPPYPEEAGNLDGYVILRLLINEAGKVDEAIVVQSEPAGIFDLAARDAFGNILFTPGIKNGIPVKSQMMIEVRYHREEAIPHPASATEATKTIRQILPLR